MSSPSHQRRRSTARRVMRITLAVVVSLVLVLILALKFGVPALLQKQAEDFAQTHTLHLDGEKTLVLDWLQGRATIGPVLLGQTAAAPLRFEHLSLLLDWKALLQQHVTVESIAFSDLALEITRTETGVLINSINPTALFPPSQSNDQSTADPSWQVTLQTITCEQCTVRYQDPEGRDLEIYVEALTLGPVQLGRPDAPVSFDLQGHISDGPRVTLQGTATPGPEGSTQLTLTTALKDLPLNRIPDYAALSPLPDLAGKTDLQFQGDVTLAETITAAGDLTVAGQEITVAQDTLAVAAETLAITLKPLQLTLSADSQSLSATGHLETTGLRLTQDVVEITAKDLTLDLGDTTATLGPDGPRIEAFSAALRADAPLTVTDRNRNKDISIAVEAAAIENLSWGTDTAQALDLQFKALVDDFTALSVTGSGPLMARTPNGKVSLNISDLQLAAASPYAERFAGVHLNGGQFGTQTRGTVKDGMLDAVIDLSVQDLSIRPVSDDAAEDLAAQYGMPLQSIVALLRDNDNRIALKIPVTGDVQKPDFDLSQAIGRALGKVLRGAFSTTLKVMFPPTIVVGLIMDNPFGDPTFKPVAFPAGISSLTTDGRDYLQTIVTVLNKRKNLRLQVCGRATRADLMAIRRTLDLPLAEGSDIPDENRVMVIEALNTLVEARTRSVRQLLINDNSIPVSRIGACRAEVDLKNNGAGRVDIRL